MNPHIEWAGVAVRLADGTIYAFEMEGFIVGEIKIEQDFEEEPNDLTYRTYRPIGTDISVELRGRGVRSARFADAAKERSPGPALTAAPLEIEP